MGGTITPLLQTIRNFDLNISVNAYCLCMNNQPETVFFNGFEDRPIHVVCSPKEDYLAIITAYLPDEREWRIDFKQRKLK